MASTSRARPWRPSFRRWTERERSGLSFSARFGLALVLGVLWFAPAVKAELGAREQLVDRAVVRLVAPELGGERSPAFVMERELRFFARVEAMEDAPVRDAVMPRLGDEHVRRAEEQIISEILLASLSIEPRVAEAELISATAEVEQALLARLGGDDALRLVLRAEGLAREELTRWLRRRARAQLYLWRMVAPMVTPTRTELRDLFLAGNHPYRGTVFERAEPGLRRIVIAARLDEAMDNYYLNARQRLRLTILGADPS